MGDKVKLHEKLVDSLLDYADMQQCVRWTLHFHLGEEQVPCQVWDAINEDLVHLQDQYVLEYTQYPCTLLYFRSWFCTTFYVISCYFSQLCVRQQAYLILSSSIT